MSPADIAGQLLAAQVEFTLAELTGERLTTVTAELVDAGLEAGTAMVTREVINRDRAAETVLTLVDHVGGSDLIGELVAAFSDAIYDHTANDEYKLGEVVDRDPTEALIEKVLSMHQLHDRALDRLTESPLMATLAAKFVNRIVTDFVQENRERAEKLPGMSAVMSIGQAAAKRARKISDGNPLLGEIAGKGAQYALRRNNNAIREILRDASAQNAAMEIWDLHADEPMSGLRAYLSRQDLLDLTMLIYEISLSTREKDYLKTIVGECVDVFFVKYGDHSLTGLLPELGVSRDDIVAEAGRHIPAVLAAAREDGSLERIVRARLEPFYAAESTLAILSGTTS
jgi:hypothetical protein